MKKEFLFAFIGLAFFSNAFAFGGCGTSCGPLPGCGGDSCQPYVNICECTDPVCGYVDKGCLSTCQCCQAFGNIGGR